MKRKLIVLLVLMSFILGGVPGWGIEPSAVESAYAASSANDIVLSEPGHVLVTIQSLGAGCTGSAGLASPGPQEEMFNDYKAQEGESYLFDRTFAAGEPLVFYIHPGEWCGVVKGANALSSDPTRALVTLIGPDTWRIEWEDLPATHKNYDEDFNDLILIVRRPNQVFDYKQNDPAWADEAYDHVPGRTIGEMGSALTAAASILSYHGGVDDSITRSPLTVDALNACMALDRTGGYYNGAVRWDRLGWCSDATRQVQPFLTRWVGKLALDDGLGSTPEALRTAAAADLKRGMPVIFEVPGPDASSGVSYLVGKAYDEVTGVFTVNDPWCESWSGPACSDPQKTLGPAEPLTGLIRFATQGVRAQKVLILNAPAGVHFLVTDTQGKRTGSDGSQSFAEIPNSNYYRQDPIALQPGGAAEGEAMNELFILNPQPGAYQVTVYGTEVPGKSLRGDYQFGSLLSRARPVTLELSGEQHTLFVLNSNIFWDRIELYLPLVTQD